MKQTCLLLGGAGFIGSNLVKELLNKGYDVKLFDQKNFTKTNISEFVSEIEVIEGDFSNISDVKKAMEGVDYIYHLISTTLPSTSLENILYDIESNVIPTVQLLKACLEFKIKKIIFISSGGTVYGEPQSLPIPESHSCNPITSYGIVKRTIENYFQLYEKIWGLNCCVFRLSNPYGEKQNPKGIQGIIPVLLYKAINNEEIQIWGDGEVIRDYIHIDDVTNVLVQSINSPTPAVVYNLGSGNGTSINQLLNIIRQNINPNLNVSYIDKRNFDIPINVLDISNLRKAFKFENPLSLETGIINLHQFLKK